MPDTNDERHPEADSPQTRKHGDADTPAARRDPAEDAIQRPGVAATSPSEQPPKAGQRWTVPMLAAGGAIVVLLLIVFL